MAFSHRLSQCLVRSKVRCHIRCSASVANLKIGLEVVKPDISSGTIIGVSCAILVLLFIVQPLGIHKIASVFAPIVVIWLLFNLTFGIYVSIACVNTANIS